MWETLALGVLMAAVYAHWWLPRTEGGTPLLCPTWGPLLHRGRVLVAWGREDALHLHHWMLCLPLAVWAWMKRRWLIAGLSLGMVLQGLTYTDRFDVWEPNPYCCPAPAEPPLTQPHRCNVENIA
jgi:hypothetical protein